MRSSLLAAIDYIAMTGESVDVYDIVDEKAVRALALAVEGNPMTIAGCVSERRAELKGVA